MAKSQPRPRISGALNLMHSKKLRKELDREHQEFPKYDHQINKINDRKEFALERIALLEKELKKRKKKTDEPANKFDDED